MGADRCRGVGGGRECRGCREGRGVIGGGRVLGCLVLTCMGEGLLAMGSSGSRSVVWVLPLAALPLYIHAAP